MFGGFGAIRAMQVSLKMNRDQMKNRRKSSKELSKSHPAKIQLRKKLLAHDLVKVEETRKRILEKRKQEKKKKLSLLALLILFGISFITLLFL